MDYPAEMQRAAGDTREERREKRPARVEWLNRKITQPVRVETVEKIVYVDREGPERIVERLVEAKAKIDAREPAAAPVPAELAAHVNEGETIPQAKQRFLQLYRDLGNKIHMPGLATDADRRLHESLHAQMNWIVRD